MTKTKNQKSRASSRRGTSARHHSWSLALIIILIIIAVVVVIVLVVKPQPKVEVKPSTPETSTPSEESAPSTSLDPQPTPETPDYPENKTTQYEGEDPNNLEELTGAITYSGVDGDILTVMTMIHQQLAEPGTCALTLTGRSSHRSYTASGKAFTDVSTSSCETFEIPVSELVSDTYDIEIKITGNQKTGTIRGEVSL